MSLGAWFEDVVGQFSPVFTAIVIAFVALVPVLHYSIYQVRVNKRYGLHKKLQIFLSIVLFVAVVVFEIDVRVSGWMQRMRSSPYIDSWLYPVLGIHLLIAIATTVLWILVVYGALKHIPTPPVPNAYTPTHRKRARLAVQGFHATILSGAVFYWMAFIAKP